MVTNDQVGELEQLTLTELVVDKSREAELIQNSINRADQEREKIKRENLCKQLLHYRVKHECWDNMETQAVSVTSMTPAANNNHPAVVSNFMTRKLTAHEERLRKISNFYRSVNLLEGAWLNNNRKPVDAVAVGDEARAKAKEDRESFLAAQLKQQEEEAAQALLSAPNSPRKDNKLGNTFNRTDLKVETEKADTLLTTAHAQTEELLSYPW